MVRRRHPDENVSCRVDSMKWLGDREEQDDRRRVKERKMVRGVEGESQRIKQ